MKDEHKHYFQPFEIGDITDKGKIDDLFFLQFTSGAGAWKIYEPEGKGILMATIDKKDYAIGELKLIEPKVDKL